MSSSIFRFANSHRSHPAVTERLASVAHDTVDRFAERVGEMEQELRSRASVLGRRAMKQESRARAALDAQLNTARDYVRKPSRHGLNVAMVAGIVIGGLLLMRR